MCCAPSNLNTKPKRYSPQSQVCSTFSGHKTKHQNLEDNLLT